MTPCLTFLLSCPPQELDGKEMIECIKKLVTLETDWIPSEEGFSLYLRPTAIGTHAFLGVSASDQVKVFVITCPVGECQSWSGMQRCFSSHCA